MRFTNRYALLLVPLFIFSMNAQAKFDSVDGLRKAYPPYRIKPNTPSYAPSGYSPAQMRSAYGLTSIASQGAGQVIAIIDAYDNPNVEADLNVFSSTFQLPACTTANGCFQKVYATGTQPAGDTGWGVEMSLDVQWAHAIAPQAKIMLVEAANSSFNALFTAISVAIQKGATAISMSWGGGEFSSQSQFDPVFNVPGVAFTASSGDGGTGVIYPSSSPNVIAVGGTTLNIDSTGKYVSETAWAGSGGGLSAFETVPAYQSQYPIPNNPNKFRGIPDVSYNADPGTGVSVYDSYGNSGWMVVGGTSAGAPQWAAFIAVAKSATTQPVNQVNSMFYTLAKSNYSGLFHDITSGTNGSCGYYCTAQTNYDYVTGIGSPIGSTLIPAISSTTPTPPPPTNDCTMTATCSIWGTPQDSWSGSSCNFAVTKPTGLTDPTTITMVTEGIHSLSSVWNATATLTDGQVVAKLTQAIYVPSFGFTASGVITIPSTAQMTTNGKNYNCAVSTQ